MKRAQTDRGVEAVTTGHSLKRVIKRSEVNRVNQALVLNLIREQQPISRIAISRKTGLHKSTVTALVKHLARQRLIVENGAGPSTKVGGRKPLLLSLDSRARKVLGVEIQPSSIKVALADFSGAVDRSWLFDRQADPNRCLKTLSGRLARIVRECGGAARFVGIGVSCPGIVDAESGALVFSSPLNWRDVPIARTLEAAVGVPVALDNDTFLCALAERWYGSRSVSEFAFVHVAEGLGVGLFIEGHLRRGFGGGGSHNFGHMTIDIKGPLCQCGNRGCWEAFASNRATVDRYRSLRGRANIAAILRRAGAGEKAAVKTLVETGTYLGVGIANIVNGLNLPAFFIGGEIVSAWSIIEQPLRHSVERHAFPEYLKNVSIAPASLGQQSSLVGAIAKGLSHHFDLLGPLSAAR
jgi:N-acetylglucosamine repressor